MKNAFWENIFKGWQKEESATVLTLKQVPIFHDFSNREFRDIEKLIHQRTYKPQDYVFKRQAPGEGMYIILSGKVEIFANDAQGVRNVFAVLGEGDFFGEMSLLDAEPRSASAIAIDHTILLGFFRPDLMSLLDRNPDLGNRILLNLAKVVVERLRKTNDLLTEAQKQQASNG
ncbi:MAG: cyclic nucleotide-binding domain-containing protein [Candidatus Marinimicrobia bacterium]|nr:cyclic nucleotide-binding domain-containing protein [Candidatus Neomarinimicrobiota bacterium]